MNLAQWPRADKLALLGLIATVLIGIIAFVTPELRGAAGLDPGVTSTAANHSQHSWIAVICLVVAFALTAYQIVAWRRRRLFHATPVGNRLLWGTAVQGDHSVSTQISGDVLVKNLTERPLNFVGLRLIKPFLSAEVVASQILPDGGGSTTVLPGCSKSFLLHMLVRGAPRSKSDTLVATVGLADDEGREQRIRLRLKNPALREPAMGVPLVPKSIALWMHLAGLLSESAGAFLVFMEARRILAQLGAAGHVDYVGTPPPGYQSWLYDSGVAGFGLILVGILLAGVALFLEHAPQGESR